MSEPAHGPSYADLLEKLKQAEVALGAPPYPASHQLLIQFKKVCDERELFKALLTDILLHWQASDILRLRTKRLLEPTP